jgi:branched-chain amino acid transport system substrate-binding protein
MPRWVRATVALVTLGLVVTVAAGFRQGSELSRGKLVIGYGNNLSGFLAVHDHLISDGAKLAVAQINAKGGIGGKIKIQLKLKDTKTDLATSVQVANEFAADRSVKILLLPCNTDFQEAMAQVADRKNLLTVSPCNGDPTVPKRYPVYWPVGVAGNAQMAQLADYAKSRGYKRAWVLDSPQQLYAHLMAKYFRKAAPSRGISVTHVENIPFGQAGFPSDYSAVVTKIKDASPKPQVIMTGIFTPFVDFFIKQLRQAGVNTPVIGSDGMDTTNLIQAGGAAVNGTTFTTFGYPSKGSATARFYAAYKARFGSRPDGSFTALGYDSIKAIEKAVLRGGGYAPRVIESAFKAAPGLVVNGALGRFQYPGHGRHNPTNPVAVVQVRNGKFVLVKKSVPKKVPAP